MADAVTAQPPRAYPDELRDLFSALPPGIALYDDRTRWAQETQTALWHLLDGQSDLFLADVWFQNLYGWNGAGRGPRSALVAFYLHHIASVRYPDHGFAPFDQLPLVAVTTRPTSAGQDARSSTTTSGSGAGAQASSTGSAGPSAASATSSAHADQAHAATTARTRPDPWDWVRDRDMRGPHVGLYLLLPPGIRFTPDDQNWSVADRDQLAQDAAEAPLAWLRVYWQSNLYGVHGGRGSRSRVAAEVISTEVERRYPDLFAQWRFQQREQEEARRQQAAERHHAERRRRETPREKAERLLAALLRQARGTSYPEEKDACWISAKRLARKHGLPLPDQRAFS